MIKNFISILIILPLFYFIGCNEQPTELGYKIDSVSFVAVSSSELDIITSAESRRYYLAPFNKGIMQVGNFDNLSSYPIIRYGNIDSLDGTEIISATLNLIKSGYALGDTTELQSFEIFEVQQPILPSTTYETLFKTVGIDQVYKDELMGQFEMPYNQIEDTSRIELNTQLIKNWIEFSVLENDPDNPLDTNDIRRKYSYSIGLKPTANSKIINGFLSDRIGNSGLSAPNPFIRIVYRRDGVQDTVDLRSNIAAYYADGPIPDANSLTVQAGLAARSQLDFDLSEIPKFASIVKAVLKIYIDDSKSTYGSFGKDSFLLAQKDVSLDDTYLASTENLYIGIRAEGTNYFKFTSITSAVEDWVQADSKDDMKGSLLLNYAPNANPSDSYFRLDKFFLYGSEAEEALRPELTIFYAKRPEF